MRSPTLWLAGATAVTIAAATTAAAAGPLGPSRLAASPGTSSSTVAGLASTELAPSAPDFGRRRGNPGAAPAPVAKVSLTEADTGKTIVVKPGTEIDVTLKPDSGKRWAPPRSDHPQTVSGGRGGGWQGRGWGGPGGRQAAPDFPGPGGPGGGKRDGSTHGTFFARQAGDANLNSAEGGGFRLLMPPSGPAKKWSVKVTVSGPAPAAPKKAAPAAVVPAAPAAPVSAAPAAPSAPRVSAPRLVTPVTPAVRRLLISLPRL
jgi:hypothetical protein